MSSIENEKILVTEGDLSFSENLRKWNPLQDKNYIKAVQLLAAVLVGISAYLYAKWIAWIQSYFTLAFHDHSILVSLATPLMFAASVWLVIRLAPEAKGSGIPQVLQAIEQADSDKPKVLASPLVSMKTAFIKVVGTTVGILGGASIGREGPTVQIAASVFAWTARWSKRYLHLIDFRSFLVAGASAGISAAFNTPLAGITFALEEIAEETFGQFKRAVMLTVIVGGITAQALGGDYLYFGHPPIEAPSWLVFPAAVVIGLCGGIFGGFFSLILGRSSQFRFLPQVWWKKALVCGLICGFFTYISQGDTVGSGYETTRQFMDDPNGKLSFLFFPEKFLTTVFSYLSGMAGGIFSPCLSIGAGMGFSLGSLFHVLDLKVCALVGMVAFFSGVVQAPLTAVVIIMEMTDQHMLIIPFMIAAFLAHGTGKLIMPTPLYRYLAFGDETKVKTEL